MNDVLTLENVCKKYPSFSLKDVSFSVKPGEIMGFIGRNGAGKTTTLKSIMNLVHYEKGKITAFDMDMKENELAKNWFCVKRTQLLSKSHHSSINECH